MWLLAHRPTSTPFLVRPFTETFIEFRSGSPRGAGLVLPGNDSTRAVLRRRFGKLPLSEQKSWVKHPPGGARSVLLVFDGFLLFNYSIEYENRCQSQA